jgi:hypothetical protein
METAMQNIYESPPMKIGKHQWRIVITPQGYTQYEFKRPPIKLGGFMVTDDTWRNYREWPEYDINDGTYGGMPRTLRKLWEANRLEIERILYGKEPAQMELLQQDIRRITAINLNI